MKKAIAILMSLILVASLKAQKANDLQNRASIVIGTNQLLIDGFNIEGNLFWNRLVFDYSHGVSLNLDNDLLSGDAKEQRLAVHIPYSTGFGVGYRFNDWFNMRVEPKWHKFELYYDRESQNSSNQIASYKTFTLGIGAYVNWLPFKSKANFLRGITIAPSLRWWPNVSGSIDGDLSYNNQLTGQQETHEALNIGFGNSPLLANISIGYSINFN